MNFTDYQLYFNSRHKKEEKNKKKHFRHTDTKRIHYQKPCAKREFMGNPLGREKLQKTDILI